jgi:hypothetical protein
MCQLCSQGEAFGRPLEYNRPTYHLLAWLIKKQPYTLLMSKRRYMAALKQYAKAAPSLFGHAEFVAKAKKQVF